MAKLRVVPVTDETLSPCFVKAARAEDLSREEALALMSWCDCQTEDLWNDMSLQEILNVYRVSAEWDTFEGWAEDEGDIARRAWNRVVRTVNRLRLNERGRVSPAVKSGLTREAGVQP